VLWVGAIIVVPGLWAILLAKRVAKEVSERKEFREHVQKTYGNNSRHEHDTSNV
jgi:hypothetical protein